MPPPLPESTLIIAPNKGSASKKRKRPAFRPGGKKKAAPKEKSKTSPTQTTHASAETKPPSSETEPIAASPEPTSLFPASPKDREVPKKTQDSKVRKESNARPAKSARTATTAEDILSESVQTAKENNPLAPKQPARKGRGKVKNKELTSEESPSKTPAKTSTATAPAQRRSTKASAKSAATKIASVATKSAPALKRGRKPKSTGLVVGASRLQVGAQQQQQQQQKSAQTSVSANTPEISIAAAAAGGGSLPPLANVSIEPATNAVAAIPLQLPPPKEGETALGQFCSKFKVKPRNRAAKGQGGTSGSKKKRDEAEKKKSKAEAKQAQAASQGPVVQIINGEIVFVGQKGEHQAANADGGDEEEYAVVEEDNEMAIVGASYNSFVNRNIKPQHWSVEETKLFYEALRQVGTDFLLMSEFYPHRTRKQLKRKYQKEVSQNPKLVELALHPTQQKPLDLSIFQVDKTDIEEVKEQQKKREEKEKERAAKQEEEKKQEEEQEAARGEAVQSTAKEMPEEENGMEVVVEEYNQEPEVPDKPPKKPRAQKKKSNVPLLPEPSAIPAKAMAEKEPLWPDSEKENTAMDEDDRVVEEDTMMLEEFHHPDPENFDDIPAHEEDNTDIIGEVANISTTEDAATKDQAKRSDSEPSPPHAVAAAKQPAISLVPTANKKKPSAKKPKFRSPRPAKKKK